MGIGKIKFRKLIKKCKQCEKHKFHTLYCSECKYEITEVPYTDMFI